MTSSTKTYFLAPNFDFPPPPSGLIDLGSIITDPKKPDRSLNKGELVLIPAHAIFTTTKTDWTASRSQLHAVDGGIWTSFLQTIIGLSAEVDVSRSKGKDEVYRCKVLETQYFQPDDAYILANLQNPRVQGYVKTGWPVKKSVYMITGLKIARGVSAETEVSEEYGVGGKVGVDATAFTGGVPVSGGPKGKWSSKSSEGIGFGGSEDFVFAFRLIKIKPKKEGCFEEGDYNKAALYDLGTDVEGDVDVARVLLEDWEIEPLDQVTGMQMSSMVDEDGETCKVFCS
jgi:hypothetical protein